MKNKINLKSLGNFLIIIICAGLIILTGCSKQGDAPKEQQQEISSAKNSVDSTLIRDKNIDVSSIDKNKDGKVFQCPMDYDVISDSGGVCPKCGMTLREEPVKQAQEYLKKSEAN